MAWSRVTLLPDVTIGVGSTVAGGVMVPADLLPNGLHPGLPNKLIRMFEPGGGLATALSTLGSDRSNRSTVTQPRPYWAGHRIRWPSA